MSIQDDLNPACKYFAPNTAWGICDRWFHKFMIIILQIVCISHLYHIDRIRWTSYRYAHTSSVPCRGMCKIETWWYHGSTYFRQHNSLRYLESNLMVVNSTYPSGYLTFNNDLLHHSVTGTRPSRHITDPTGVRSRLTYHNCFNNENAPHVSRRVVTIGRAIQKPSIF